MKEESDRLVFRYGKKKFVLYKRDIPYLLISIEFAKKIFEGADIEEILHNNEKVKKDE